jgi:glycosyltransferase involved in cell wall biosynthesis
MLKARTNPPFRVLYDLRWMELGQAGGVEQATYELINTIANLDGKNTYRVFAPRSACWEWDFPRGFKVNRIYSDSCEASSERFHAFVAQCHVGRIGRIDRNDSASREFFDDLEFEIVHSTCGYIHPEMLEFPGVLTIHDLQHLHYPDFFSKAEFNDREQLYRSSAAIAKQIICSSEFTRQDVHEKFGVPLERMSTVWAIPSAAAWREVPASTRHKVLSGMGIEGPYLFYPAHGWPHKNHARLVEAFALALPDLPKNIKLVLTGRPFQPEHPAAVLIRQLGLETRVMHLGYRSPLEIRVLFREMVALIFPSLFEGFGMPVAEAIIAGKPVLCSNVTSLPEIIGDAGITFDPANIGEMSSRMVEIATQAAVRSTLGEASLLRRRVFSPQVSAIRTIAAYESAFGNLFDGA